MIHCAMGELGIKDDSGGFSLHSWNGCLSLMEKTEREAGWGRQDTGNQGSSV